MVVQKRIDVHIITLLGLHMGRPLNIQVLTYQNSSMRFVNQFVKIEYIFKIKKYCII